MTKLRIQARRMLRSCRFILEHPLSRRHRAAALWRYARFHIRHLVFRGPSVYPWLGGLRVLADRGLDLGAVAGNLYTGLADFEEMGFLLHFLRPGDLFVDIGANVGMYTMLASGICGADTIAAEPSPRALRLLGAHLCLNGLESRVKVHPVALGASPGVLPFREDLGPMSRVVGQRENNSGLEEFIHVPCVTLDQLLNGRSPIGIKIDVEGYESLVLRGGLKTLRGQALQAIIIEMLNSEKDTLIENHQTLLQAGLRPVRYEPFTRSFVPLDTFRNDQFNTLYLRDLGFVERRVLSGPRIDLYGEAF